MNKNFILACDGSCNLYFVIQDSSRTKQNNIAKGTAIRIKAGKSTMISLPLASTNLSLLEDSFMIDNDKNRRVLTGLLLYDNWNRNFSLSKLGQIDRAKEQLISFFEQYPLASLTNASSLHSLKK